eukprot:7609162-Pyramimonas_sp.AAC.1
MPAKVILAWRGHPWTHILPFVSQDEEMHAMLYHRAIGNPTNAEVIDDDPLRGSPRDAGDLSERVQYELGHNEE